jgi:putative DNA primase/helicase
MFLDKLVNDKGDWPNLWKAMQGRPEFKALSVEGQDQRVAARFALIALAGETAVEYGILPWPVGSAIEAAAEMFKTWKAGREVAGNSEPRQIKNAVRDFVERHAARFERLDVGYGERSQFQVRDRAGWVEGEGVYFFTAGGFKEAISARVWTFAPADAGGRPSAGST